MYSFRNITRDTLREQGMTSIGDWSVQALRRIDTRLISVQNSSPTSAVGIAFTTYLGGAGPVPKILKVLRPGEDINISVNSRGLSDTQTLWMLDPRTGHPVGVPETLKSNANAFVLRDGLQKWFIQAYRFPSYNAAK